MEKINKLESDIKGFNNQILGKSDYEFVKEKYKFIENKINNIMKGIENVKEDPVKFNPETNYNYFIEQINDLKDKIRETIKKDSAPVMQKYLNEIKGFLPKTQTEPQTEQEQPEQPEQQQAVPEPEQQEPEMAQRANWLSDGQKQDLKNNVSSQLTKGALPVRVSGETPRPNPHTPIDYFEKPEEQPEPEEEEKEPQPGQQHSEESDEEEQGNNNQIVQSPNENNKLIERKIKTLEDNPDLDIIKGVGEVIEFIATSNLTPEMTDKIYDKVLTMKDSHGNLLFNNRFQIEDLVLNRKKRKRLRYLLPKRIVDAEKPDEQELIINPMLRRGRIASMTSAKERYYNYV